MRLVYNNGQYPHSLLVSTIISIPKDLKLSMCNVDNYRGILFNAIAKVFDYVIIKLGNDQITGHRYAIRIQRQSFNYTLLHNAVRDFAIL